MKTAEKNVTETDHCKKALAFHRQLLASKLQTQKEMLDEFENNPEKRKLFEKLRQKNAKRGTPLADIWVWVFG